MGIKTKLAKKADASFVDNWRSAWKWFSVQFSVVMGAVVMFAATEPDMVLQFVSMFPKEVSVPLGFLVSTVIPIYLRLRPQGEISNGE